MEIGPLQMVLLLLVLVAAVPLIRLVSRHERDAKLARVAGRSTMDFDEFYRAFYAGSGLPADVVRRALQEVAELSGIPAVMLRPTDRFDKELAPVRGSEFGDGLALLSPQMRRRLKRAHLTEDLSAVKTLDDFIRHIARSEPNQQPGR